MAERKKHLIIVGAGLSGLSAALEAEANGYHCTLIDRAEKVGGRVRTDEVEGFLCDRGFQVLQSAYSEIQRLNVLPELSTKSFASGAFCHTEEGDYSLYNPLKHPGAFFNAWPGLPKGWMADFFHLGRILLTDLSFQGSTEELLNARGLSPHAVDNFLRPFFGGVFLDTALQARAQLFVNYLRLFVRGEATLPASGMQALPEALFKRLKHSRLKTETEVSALKERGVLCEDGEEIEGDATVLALDFPALRRLLPGMAQLPSQSVRCLYFAVPQGKLVQDKLLHLSARAPIVNLCVPNHIQPSYAPTGWDLISATVVDACFRDVSDLHDQVEAQIMEFFPALGRRELQLLAEYKITHALPGQNQPPAWAHARRIEGYEALYLAGEVCDTASINGAIRSGRKTVLELLQSNVSI